MLENIQADGELSEQQVVEIESTLGIGLPARYRALLMSTGGGYLKKSYVFPEPELDGSAILCSFYDTARLVRKQHRGFNEVIPHEYIAVGGGGGGSLCVKIDGADVGSVWWADMDRDEVLDAEEPVQEIMLRLADDFDAFLEAIDEQYRVGYERDV